MHFSKLFRVKEGKLDTLKEWFVVLGGDRREEALATFEHENVTREVFVLFKGHNDENYVIGYNEVNGEPKGGDEKVKINQEHSRVKEECLEPVSERGEVLLDLKL
jgi:hypothetical protein